MDFANKTNFVVPDCAFGEAVSKTLASPELPSTQTCAGYGSNREQSIFLPPAPHANPLPSKENVWEALTNETASEQFCKLLEEASPNSFVSKTCPDYYQPPLFGGGKPGTYFQQMLKELHGCGYDAEWCVIGTSGFGTLWRGSRLLIVATSRRVLEKFSRNPSAWEYQIRSESTYVGHTPEKRSVQPRMARAGVWTADRLDIAFVSVERQSNYSRSSSRREEIVLTPDLPKLPSDGYSTSTPYAVEFTPHQVKESTGNYSASTDFKLKAISLWQPWASLIPLSLKHYETRSWKTNYRGKLLICSTALNSKQHKEYLKICDELQLPPWGETNFPCGCAIALCPTVDCIEMTAEFIAQQSRTEILCGDWRYWRYFLKLENIQSVKTPVKVKGKQGLFDIPLLLQENLKELLQRLNNGCSDSKQLLGCIENSPSNDAEQLRIPTSKDSPSTDGEQSNLHPSKNSPSTKRRHWGEGNGTIHWRTITKNGKDYPQAYYHWKENGKKRSKYINQQLIKLVQEAESQKRPVIEILVLLGVVPAQVPKTLLGCIESSPSNNAEQLGIPTSKDSPSTSDGQLSVPTSKDIPSKTRRDKGSGTGSIQWKVITLNGKDYPQAWYHYEFWKDGDRQVKKSRYIPKRLLTRIQELEAEKAPVKEILKLLRVKL